MGHGPGDALLRRGGAEVERPVPCARAARSGPCRSTGQCRMRAADGSFRQVILLGLDDATLTGVMPRRMLLGPLALAEPDAVIPIALATCSFPRRAARARARVQLNDHGESSSASRGQRAVRDLPGGVHAPFGTPSPTSAAAQHAVLRARGRPPGRASREADPRDLCADRAGGRALTASGARPSASVANTGIWSTSASSCWRVLIGMVVAGQTFYLFTLGKPEAVHGVLKAIGVSDGAHRRDDPAAGLRGRPDRLRHRHGA